MVTKLNFKKYAMFLLKTINKKSIGKITFNNEGIENNYWQEAYIEFDIGKNYTVRYFPNRYIRDYTFWAKPHKTYFEGWYVFTNGEYDTYKASDGDIKLCKKLLRSLDV